MSTNDQKRFYSIKRALEELSGLEREVHEEFQKIRGNSRHATDGVLVSEQAIAIEAYRHLRRYMSSAERGNLDQLIYGGNGAQSLLSDIGFLTGQSNGPDLFTELLLNQSILGQLGVTVFSDLGDRVRIPQQKNFNWIWSDPNQFQISAHEGRSTIGVARLSPGSIYRGNELPLGTVREAPSSVIGKHMADLITGAAEALSDTLINGSDKNAEPCGILNASGLQAMDVSPSSLTMPIVDHIEKRLLAIDNTLQGSNHQWAYIFNHSDHKILSNSECSNGQSKMIIKDDHLNRAAAICWNRMPAGAAVVGFFQQAVIGLYAGGVEFRLVRRPQSVDFYGVIDADVSVLYPHAFIQIKEAELRQG